MARITYWFLIIGIALSLTACHEKEKKALANQSLNDMTFIKGGTYTMGPTNPDWQAGNNTPPHGVFYRSQPPQNLTAT